MQQFAGASSCKRNVLAGTFSRWAEASDVAGRSAVIATTASTARSARPSGSILSLSASRAPWCMSAAHERAWPLIQRTVQETDNALPRFPLCRPLRLGSHHCPCPRLQGRLAGDCRPVVARYSERVERCRRLYDDQKYWIHARSADQRLRGRRIRIPNSRDEDGGRRREDATDQGGLGNQAG